MEYRVDSNIKNFIFGGKAEFTIRNLVSNKGAKYKINNKDDMYFTYVKESNKYVYAGFFKVTFDKDRRVNGYSFVKGKKGKYDSWSPEIKGLRWVILHSDNMDSRIAFYHHGRCACCGRKLDDDNSIKLGFGPVCAKMFFKG